MDMTLRPGKLAGSVTVPSSKSMAHRLLICAAFAKRRLHLILGEINEDIAATAEGLDAICHGVKRNNYGYAIGPCELDMESKAVINCRESGSTLRFLLPIVGALGMDATFQMEGRLPQRPLSSLWEEMERMGCKLKREGSLLHCTGKLRPGHYRMDGSISSQFISGLMMALPLIEGETSLEITGNVESKPYIEMTRHVLDLFQNGCPERIEVEGDWSSAAFWLAANALGNEISMLGLNNFSPQGDREIVGILPKMEEYCTVSCSDIPDLVPILAIVAAAKKGATFTGIRRLRLKESDRVASIIAMVESLGGKAESTENILTVYGTGFTGGTVDSFGDHRIAMAAAIAATVCKESVTILGAECAKKSYPAFWEDYGHLGGNYGKNLW